MKNVSRNSGHIRFYTTVSRYTHTYNNLDYIYLKYTAYFILLYNLITIENFYITVKKSIKKSKPLYQIRETFLKKIV